MHGSRHYSIGIICIERQSLQFSTVTAGKDDSPALNSTAKTYLKDLTDSVSRYPRKKQISVDPADYIAKRIRGLDGRPIIANKKFDYDRRTFVENKKDYDFGATFQEQFSVVDMQFLDRKNTIVHIDDVVLTGANLECLTKAYCYDDDKKSISPEIIDAFVEHYGHTKPGMEMHT
ncbi:hypothetical protein OsI_22688 [Oryza sativa Indica Group]|uniref:Uncharacterized protein n=1 Tax=Oryza sativa subsp. indica TaxID=39946 RepID=A2YC56_ORYSI|nr:hypothetical protein OsI_22688 [Oryza sativa Indica Group]